jgi:hypothetical protein
MHYAWGEDARASRHTVFGAAIRIEMLASLVEHVRALFQHVHPMYLGRTYDSRSRRLAVGGGDVPRPLCTAAGLLLEDELDTEGLPKIVLVD